MAKSSTTGRALAFDAYGTLFDVFSVTALCEQLFPGKGTQLAQTWRVKQLQYSLMRSLMGRHRDFWGLTEDGLVWASKNLKVDLTADNKKQLMDAYLALAAFPDVKPGLQAVKQQGLKLAILSNGEPKMLEAAAKSAGIRDLLDEIISVEEVNFKTSNRVYSLGTERLKVSNQELGFVSANNWDGVAAVSGWIADVLESSAPPPRFPRNWASRSTSPSRRSPTSRPCCAARAHQGTGEGYGCDRGRAFDHRKAAPVGFVQSRDRLRLCY